MLELNKVHFGNNVDLIKKIDDNSVDIVVSDGPHAQCEWFPDVYRVLKDNGYGFFLTQHDKNSIDTWLYLLFKHGFYTVGGIVNIDLPITLKYFDIFLIGLKNATAVPFTTATFVSHSLRPGHCDTQEVKIDATRRVVESFGQERSLDLFRVCFNKVKLLTSDKRLLVLDLYAGVATAGVVAFEFGYDYIGFEMDKEIYAAADARLRSCNGSKCRQ